MEPNQGCTYSGALAGKLQAKHCSHSLVPGAQNGGTASEPPFPQHLCRPARSSQRSPPFSPSPSSSSSSTANPPSSRSPIRAPLPLVVLSAPGSSTRTRATPSSCKIVRSSSASGQPRSDRAYCPCYTFPFPSLIRVPICTPPFSFDAWILRPPPPTPSPASP